MKFEIIDGVPTVSVRKLAEITGMDVDQLTADLVKNCECGIYTGGKEPAVEVDDLYDYLEFRNPRALRVIFGPVKKE